jgi:TolB-like protein
MVASPRERRPFVALASPLVTVAWLAVAGCTSIAMQKTMFTPGVQGRIAAVAVTPMQDLSGNIAASSAVTSAIVTELRRRGTCRVIEIDNPAPGAGERWTAAKLGAGAKADAVLVGVVTAYGYDSLPRHGGATVSPTIGLDLRLVSSKSAEILWAASVEARQIHLLRDDGMPLGELAQDLAEKVASALADLGA